MIARHLVANQSGAAIIELALVAPFLALMVVGITDMSTAFGRKLSLEQAAQRSIEKVMQTTGDTTVAATIQKEAVCQVNGANPDGTCMTGRLTTANVTVTYRLECTTTAGARTSQTSGDATVFDAFTCANATDREARYIDVALTDSYDAIFALNFTSASAGHYPLKARAGVRVQ
jgi:Flp pilus assembly protein TadG